MDELLGIVKDAGSERLKIVYDVANAAGIGENPAASLLAVEDALGLVHVSDTGLDQRGHDPIGTGVIDFNALAQAIEATCTTDNVVLEIVANTCPNGRDTGRPWLLALSLTPALGSRGARAGSRAPTPDL